MLDRPLVTIGMPTYNRADGFLTTALESALAQTYAPLEIVISDNCSTDATPEVVGRYTDDPRVRYVRHETNLGAHGNFNACLDAARGDFFLMLHDDDLIDPDMVETCVAALKGRRNVGYVRTGVRLIDADGETVSTFVNEAAGTTGLDALVAWTQCKNYWTLSSTLYETALLRDLGGFDDDLFAATCDCYATAQLARDFGGVEIADVKASFRQHDAQYTNAQKAMRWIREWERFYELLLTWAPTGPVRQRLKTDGAAFFSQICYDYATPIEDVTQRWAAYASIYATFGGRHLPPPIRGTVYRLKRTAKRVVRRGKTRPAEA